LASTGQKEKKEKEKLSDWEEQRKELPQAYSRAKQRKEEERRWWRWR